MKCSNLQELLWIKAVLKSPIENPQPATKLVDFLLSLCQWQRLGGLCYFKLSLDLFFLLKEHLGKLSVLLWLLSLKALHESLVTSVGFLAKALYLSLRLI